MMISIGLVMIGDAVLYISEIISILTDTMMRYMGTMILCTMLGHA